MARSVQPSGTDLYAKLIEDGFYKGESEFLAVPVDIAIDGILMKDFFQVTDDETRDDF